MKFTGLMSGSGLRTKVYKSGLVTTLGFGAQKGLQLLSNLILTRLLFPEAFGVMSVVYVVITGVSMVSDVGIRPSIITSKDDKGDVFLNTAWTLQILRGWAIWLVICALAYPASIIYDEPMLLSLLCVTGFSAVITGFASINLILAEKKLIVHRVVTIGVVSQLVAIVVMTAVAYVYKSVWALSIGGLIAAFVTLALGHIFLQGHKHKLAIDRDSAAQIFNFGKWVFWGTLLTYIGGQGSRAIEGVFVPMDQLGVLAIASIIAWSVGELIQKILNNVAFPALSIVDRENTAGFSKALYKIRVAVLVGAIPAFGFICLLSDQIIGFLYDERYQNGGAYLAILSIGSALSAIPMIYQNALLASGDSKSHFVISAVSSALRIAAIVIGFYFHGIIGMLIAAAISRLIAFVFTCYWIRNLRWLSLKFDLGMICCIGFFAFVRGVLL